MEDEKVMKLEQRIRQLERDVQLLQEQRLAEKEPIKPKPEPRTEDTLHTTEYKQPIVKPGTTEPPKPFEIPMKTAMDHRKEPVDWENLIGRVWLPRIFIFILLLGVIWGFKVAVDAGILNETNRVIIGFLAAILFLYIGEKQIKRNHHALGKVLVSGSVAILLLSTFAMHILYGMIPAGLAFFLNVLWVAMGIYLAHRHKSEAIGIMMTVFGYLIPFLVQGETDTNEIFLVIGYELLFYIALLIFAVRMQYKKLFYIAAVLLHFVFLTLSVSAFQYDSIVFVWMAVGMMLQHELIFGTLYFKKINNRGTFPVLFTSFVATLLWTKGGFAAIDQDLYYLLYLVVVTIRYGTVAYYSHLRKREELFPLSIVLSTIGLSCIIFEGLNNPDMIFSMYLVVGLFATYIGYYFHVFAQRFIGLIIYFLTAFMVVADPLYDLWSWDLFNMLLLIGTLYAMHILLKPFVENDVQQILTGVLLATHVLFLMKIPILYQAISLETLLWIGVIISLYILYRLVRTEINRYFHMAVVVLNVTIHLTFITKLITALTVNQSVSFEVMSISIGWALYATGCLIAGFVYQKKSVRLMGIGLLFLTLVKLVFIDLAFLDLIVRAGLFMGIGLLGIVLSRLFYIKDTGTEKED
ncbi:DUF2339 domain-containing protein [Oceanobacillus sp. CF4.6]|uniref:DUF2339 domain-containing protein n=1 Tax=Oceanobacillus sp. CF4.6 TaxID=3373080 RepID=UPI003EE6621C